MSMLPKLRRIIEYACHHWPEMLADYAALYRKGEVPSDFMLSDYLANAYLLILLDDGVERYARNPFVRLPFNENLARSVAVDIQRGALGLRASAFYTTHKLRDRVDKMVKQIVYQKMNGYITEQEFKEKLAEITGLTKNHLRVILHTQSTSVLNATKILKTTSAKFSAQWPYLRYVNRHLPRSRETHEGAHGFVALASDGIWAKILPPCGFGCLCYVAHVHREEAIRKGWMDEDGSVRVERHYVDAAQRRLIEDGVGADGKRFPDKGFTHSVAMGMSLL